MRIFQSLLAVVFLCGASAFADHRLGVNTHFDQGWNPSVVIPRIPPRWFWLDQGCFELAQVWAC
jgi:hypothetical protein